jgi:hypothetical protein
MNGGLTYAPQPANNNSDTNSVENTNGLKSAIPRLPHSPIEANGGVDPISTNGVPLHIPAKRVGGHWTSPASVASNTTDRSSYSLIDSNGTNGGSSVTPTIDPLMAVSAATSPYSTSHYSSLAASAEAVRRGGATPTGGLTDTKPGLSFWQNDYHKYAQAATAAVTPSTAQVTAGTPSVTMAAVAASECAQSQMSAAAGFAAHQAAAWNYPHPGQYASALASPEQAAAEAARARQMAAETAGFHADYTRLQYPPDGIYTHPPGMCFLVSINSFCRNTLAFFLPSLV